MNLRPPTGPVDLAASGRYADAVDRVVAVAPTGAAPFWTATARVSRSIANNGTGDAQAASEAFKQMTAVAADVSKQCGIDILRTSR